MGEFIKQKMPKVPAHPSRKDPRSEFDPKADTFLSLFPVLAAAIDAWTQEVNNKAQDWNNRYFAADSELSNLRGEMQDARMGRDTLLAGMQELYDRVQEVVEMQQQISLGEVSKVMARRPSPDDDGYPAGFYWVSTYHQDFWLCMHTEPGLAVWRRRDGELVRRLQRPTVVIQGSSATFEEVTVALENVDADLTDIEWDATGSPDLVAGDWSGSDTPQITLRWNASGDYTVRARAKGDGQVKHHSYWSNIQTILVGPSLYCGSGNYCGDGSYPGMMLE